MALENLNAAIAALNEAADRLIAKAHTDETALAQATSDLAAADANATAAVQPIVDKLNAAAPAAPAS